MTRSAEDPSPRRLLPLGAAGCVGLVVALGGQAYVGMHGIHVLLRHSSTNDPLKRLRRPVILMCMGSTGKHAGPSVRDRLLEAGVAVFSKAGFNGSSVQDITDAAGVPKGSFYNHFDSKEALGAAVIRHFWDQKASKMLALLAQDTPDPLARLRRYFEQVMTELAALEYTCGCFVGNMTAELSDHSTAISDQLSAVFAQWTQQIAGCIRLAQAAGSITSRADPEVLATFALNAWEGALLRARVTKSGRPLQQFIDTLFTQFLV